jgi:hypothetical protein
MKRVLEYKLCVIFALAFATLRLEDLPHLYDRFRESIHLSPALTSCSAVR